MLSDFFNMVSIDSDYDLNRILSNFDLYTDGVKMDILQAIASEIRRKYLNSQSVLLLRNILNNDKINSNHLYFFFSNIKDVIKSYIKYENIKFSDLSNFIVSIIKNYNFERLNLYENDPEFMEQVNLIYYFLISFNYQNTGDIDVNEDYIFEKALKGYTFLFSDKYELNNFLISIIIKESNIRSKLINILIKMIENSNDEENYYTFYSVYKQLPKSTKEILSVNFEKFFFGNKIMKKIIVDEVL